MTRDEPIGRRVARWRVRRRMTQQMLADRLGKSKSWVDKVERGVRALDRYSVIQEISEVLRVDPAVLLGEHRPPPSSGLDGVDGIRAALARYEAGGAASADEVGRHVAHAWLTYQHAHYAQVVRALPGLLDAARSLPGTDRELLVQVYRITSSILVKLGEADLGWLAADRAMAVAGGDPLLAGRRPCRSGRRCAPWAATGWRSPRRSPPRSGSRSRAYGEHCCSRVVWPPPVAATPVRRTS
ncbi:helix-turn-helix transcriptional regulator [Micromonospora sp. KC213]|uniref:helix-turn-helix domain-containing protein n=1 Tax=Micromonospora sp. KC213 TaxID=2530378 RepID=UPI001FB76965|nr:helix-turn-helix transcriptional regulator [Micromonospora sp. KC213]